MIWEWWFGSCPQRYTQDNSVCGDVWTARKNILPATTVTIITVHQKAYDLTSLFSQSVLITASTKLIGRMDLLVDFSKCTTPLVKSHKTKRSCEMKPKKKDTNWLGFILGFGTLFFVISVQCCWYQEFLFWDFYLWDVHFIGVIVGQRWWTPRIWDVITNYGIIVTWLIAWSGVGVFGRTLWWNNGSLFIDRLHWVVDGLIGYIRKV